MSNPGSELLTWRESELIFLAWVRINRKALKKLSVEEIEEAFCTAYPRCVDPVTKKFTGQVPA